ncbi:hypothetical protein [Actinacidiphila glaucinigra]|uniref:hypothetical protein n=1 Tax=Actinacidiphila glaucinigra TaxID=235986 RepID=UPI003D917B38
MARHRTPGEDPGPAGDGAERPERRTHGTPWPRDADAPRTPGQPQTDRLRYLDAATRRIAAGMDLDETLRELDAAAVPAFADAIFVHLHDPLLTGEGVEGPDAADDVVLHLHPTRRRAPERPSPGLPSPDAEAAAPEPPRIALRCVNHPAPQGCRSAYG